MAQAETKISPSCLEIKVSGKVVTVEQIEGREKRFYANTVILPAEDTYSKPIRLVVNSRLPMAEEGQLIDTVVHVVPQWRSNNGRWFFNCNLWKDKLNA